MSKWEKIHSFTVCPKCGAMFDVDLTQIQVPCTWKLPNYCPNCGEDMRDDPKREVKE